MRPYAISWDAKRTAGISVLLVAAFLSTAGVSRSEESEMTVVPTDSITITVVFDNIPFAEGYETSWGFASVVRLPEETILFDTGNRGDLLLENMRRAGIEPGDVDIVFLSHGHGDHIAGVGEFLEQNDEVTVYSLGSFPSVFAEMLAAHGIEPVVVEQPIEIFPGCWSTGLIDGPVMEQSLVIATDRGPIVITGCAHPGIVEIVRRAREIAGRDPLLVMGGFHLGRKSEEELAEIIASFKELGVGYAAPTHCTGEEAIKAFEDAYGARFLRIGAGKVIEGAGLK
jgi:7,8-dihydropterin-6-yl-methyl-4-(beta-D-ribofuranosyl)aminobenzene 5'-phosphate synthase